MLAQAGQELLVQIDRVPDVFADLQRMRVQMLQAANGLLVAGFRVGVDLGGVDGVVGGVSHFR